jgi:DNA repair protein SbcD/Mre11
MKFIHTADIHLDSPMTGLERYDGAPAEPLRLATRQSFDALVKYAIQESVDFVIISGDLFDGSWRDYRTGLYFVAKMSQLAEAGILVAVVSGNHDAANRMTRSLPLPSNVKLFSSGDAETLKLEQFGAAIHGQSYDRAAVVANLAASYPPSIKGLVNIGVLHTSLTGREGHERYAPCSVEDLVNKGYHYWALGHVHGREIVSAEPAIVFPGNLQGRHFRELGPKGFTVATLQPDGSLKLKEIFVSVADWVELVIDINGLASYDDVLEGVDASLATNCSDSSGKRFMVRISTAGSAQVHSKLVSAKEKFLNDVRAIALNRCADRVWIESVFLRSTPEMTLEQLQLLGGSIGSLFRTVATARPGDPRLEAVATELQKLKRSIPAEVGIDSYLPNVSDAEQLAQLLRDVQNALLPLALGGESL